MTWARRTYSGRYIKKSLFLGGILLMRIPQCPQ